MPRAGVGEVGGETSALVAGTGLRGGTPVKLPPARVGGLVKLPPVRLGGPVKLPPVREGALVKLPREGVAV